MAQSADEEPGGRQSGMWAAFAAVARSGSRETARFIAIIAAYGVIVALVAIAVGNAGVLASVVAAITERR